MRKNTEMKVTRRCAWCQRILGVTILPAIEREDEITDGICPACREKVEADYDKQKGGGGGVA